MMDRISNLPDEIICHIGSFLSAKDAAFSMVLSKRWSNLFTIIPELYINFIAFPCEYSEEDFMDFEDQVFALPLNSLVRKFSIILKFEDVEPARINRLICHVLKHGVEDFHLHVILEKKEDKFSLPLEVFTCKTIANLKLGWGFSIDSLPVDTFLPALKSLKLSSVRLHDPSAFNTLLSASPFPEELAIMDYEEWKWFRIVSSPTIKRLTIHCGIQDEDYDGDSEYESISFDTPVLVYLEYADCARKEYPIVNLNSLVEAKLCIWKHEDISSNPVNLIKGLKGVEILSLADQTMELIHDYSEAVPVFENLSHLTLVNRKQCCWFGLQVLIQKSPKLKTLTIEGVLHGYEDGRSDPLCECLLGYSFLLTCPIDVLEITLNGRDTGEMLHLKHILENLPCLEVLKLSTLAKFNDKKLKKKFKNDVLMIPKASSKCTIQFV